MSTILQYSKFLSLFYILFVFLNYIQSIFIVLELSYDSNTHYQVKKYTRYLYLINYLNNNNMSESTYLIFIYINFLMIIIPFILFFILCFNIPKKLTKLISISLSIYMFFEKYIYYIFSFSILLSPFKIKNNKFGSNNSDEAKYIVIKIFSLLLFVIKIIILNVIIFLFTDYSIFKKKVPWSSPFNFIDISFLYLNVYIILAGYFFHKYTLLILIINIGLSSYIIYNRIKCPFYFLTKLNYFKFYCEGSIICIDIIYPLLSYFNKSWINYDLIYLYLFVIFFGIVYAILIIYIDYNLLKKLNKKIKSYILLNKLDQYEMYIFLIKICDVIKKSIEDRKSSNLLFYFYSQHRIECDDQNCFCLKIDELINTKQLNLEEYLNYRNRNNEIFADEEEDLNKNNDEFIINDKDVFDDSFKRKKLITLNKSEKHIKLWGNLIQSILEKVINLNNNSLNNSDYLRIDYSNFLSFFLEKYVHSLIEISNVNKNNLPFYFQYYLYYSKNDLLDSNKNKEIFQREIDVNYKKILEYNRYYEKFLKIIKKTSELSVNFWSEMKKNIFQPKIFENRGYTISKNTTKLEKYSKLILANNSNDLRTLKIYGTFLNHVLKLQDESKGYMDKAFLQIVMNDDSDNINNQTLNLTNFFDNQLDSSIIVVNGNKENIGRVEYVNYYFTNLFGFSKKEIVGKNVSTIMPTNIGKYHNQFMLNFYTTTKTNFLNKTRREIGLNKEKLIHPIMIYVKIFPCIEEGISYIGLIKKTTFSNITKGPRQIQRSNNIGFIMTTVDNKLIHYNKLIEEKFQLIPSLMFEDTKDISEDFKIEMIFPEFLNNKKNILNEIKNEEKRCFFTTKVIEMSKRMEYSKLYSIVKEELEYYNEMVKKLKFELKKNNINDSSFMTKSNKSSKTYRNKKHLLANKIENSEFIKKNTAMVSLTEFNYIMNANFLIYQIVFEKGNNVNITNVIKNYQQKLLNPTEKTKTISGGILKSGIQNKKNSKTISNYLPSMMSVKSSMNTTDIMASSNKKGLIFNALSEVRNNTFKKKQPLTLLLITLVIIGMLIMIIIYVIGEFIIILIRTSKSSKSLNTVNNLGLINIDLTFLQSSVYLYGLLMIKEIDDFQTNINNLNFSNLLNYFINVYLNNIVSVKDNINQESKFDSELSYNLTESINSFYTFYDDKSFIVNKESVINSITNIINYYNNLMDILTYNYSNITINEIMIRTSIEEDYETNNISDIKLNVIKNLKTIYYNFQLIIKNYLEMLIVSLLTKNTKVTFDDFENLMTIFFIIEIVVNILFGIGYCILYYVLINLRINILKIFTEISPETEKKCLDDVIKYNKNIEMIIQNDIYFIENYYDTNNSVFQNDKKKNITNSSPDNTNITNSNNLNNINKYNDYNLGLEVENSDIKQIFNDYKKKKPISIKKYIEEQNNKETISPLQFSKKDEDNRAFNQIYNQKKRESDLKNLQIYNFKINNNSHINQLTKENSKNNLISNFETEDHLLNTNENDYKLNSSNNYRKRIIKKKAQLNKIISYRKEKCFDYIIILIILTLLIFYILVYFIPKYLLKNISFIFKELKNFCIFKFYFVSYYPLFINYLVNSEILYNNFSEILMIYYKNSSYYYNENNIFFLNNENKFKILADLYTELKSGNKSCSYISDYYNDDDLKDSIFNYCIENYFKNGEDSAIIEDLTIGLNHYNYLNDLIEAGELNSIIERKNQLKNFTLINIFIYNMLIFNPYYKNFEKDYIDYLKDSVNYFKYLYIVKLFIGFLFGFSLLLFYLKYIRIKYLNQYIYTKAMILLVPQNELLKGDNYIAIQKLIGNDK